MADPKGLHRPPNGQRYDPTAIDATGATLGHVLTAVDDGSGGQRAGWVANGGLVPTYIGPTETFTVPANRQALYAVAIDNDGALIVDGSLIEVD